MPLYAKNTRGYRMIIGVDEVGVGPLAGPVTACAFMGQVSPSLRDSKRLSPKQREKFYGVFCNDGRIIWAVASVTPKTIDRINILQARKRAMESAIKKLLDKLELPHTHNREYVVQPFLVIDGNFPLNLRMRQKSIIKGDERVPIIAAASIIAKVTRDRAMIRYHKKYPQYRFDLHKGYGTRLHYAMLAEHGPCLIHRRSFRLTKN